MHNYVFVKTFDLGGRGPNGAYFQSLWGAWPRAPWIRLCLEVRNVFVFQKCIFILLKWAL